MQLTYQKFDLPLKHVFTISRGSMAVQETLIVQLAGRWRFRLRRGDHEFVLRRHDRKHVGRHRIGSPARGKPTPAMTLALIAAIDASTSKETISRCSRFRRSIKRFTICGASCAALPCIDYGVCRPTKCHMSDYTLGIDTAEKMVAKLNEMPGWPVYKIKLGTADDLAILRELRRHTDAAFRVDANCGWTAEQTIELSPALKSYGRGVYRAAAAGGGRRWCAARVRKLGAAAHRRRELHHRGRRRPLRRPLPRHQHQAREMRWPGRGTAHDHAGARAGFESDGRLHDRIDRRHFGARRSFCRCWTTSTWTARCCWPRTSPPACGWNAGRCIYPNVNGTGVELIGGPLAEP